MKIQYIGKKLRKYDTVAGTGLVWTQNQVHEVPDEIGNRLVKYSDVWKEYHEIEAKAEAKAEAPPVLGLPTPPVVEVELPTPPVVEVELPTPPVVEVELPKAVEPMRVRPRK